MNLSKPMKVFNNIIDCRTFISVTNECEWKLAVTFDKSPDPTPELTLILAEPAFLKLFYLVSLKIALSGNMGFCLFS